MTKIKHPSIQCVAEEGDAKEHDIWLGVRMYRVLAYTPEDAQEAAEEYDRNRNEREADERRDSQADLPL